MEHDQRHWSNHRIQATAGRSLHVHGLNRRDNLCKVHWHWVCNRYLDVRVANRGKAGWNAPYSVQTRRKTHADTGSRIPVKRSVPARHGIRFGAAIEGRADPRKIQSGEIRTGGWIGPLKEHVRRACLASGIRSALGHLPMRPYLRVIGGKAQYRQQEESDKNDDDKKRLSPLSGQWPQVGALVFHAIEPPFALRHSCAWLEPI